MWSSWGHLVWRREGWGVTSLQSTASSRRGMKGKSLIFSFWWPVTGLKTVSGKVQVHYQEKVLFWGRGQELEQLSSLPRELSGNFPEFSKYLDNGLIQMIWFLSGPFRSQKFWSQKPRIQWSLCVPSNSGYSIILNWIYMHRVYEILTLIKD